MVHVSTCILKVCRIYTAVDMELSIIEFEIPGNGKIKMIYLF